MFSLSDHLENAIYITLVIASNIASVPHPGLGSARGDGFIAVTHAD